MEMLSFGPLIGLQRLSPKEVKVTSDKFLKSKQKNIKTSLPDLTVRGIMDWKDPYLLEIFSPYIENYLRGIGWNGGWKLVNLWGNIYKAKDYVPPHIHVKCDLSFVTFLKMPSNDQLLKEKREGNLVFMYGEEGSGFQKIKPKTHHRFLPKVGEIYIFPQNLRHYTVPFTNETAERISISGNITLL